MKTFLPWLEALSILVGLLWIPIAVRFFRQWRQRRNPISAALASSQLVLVFSGVSSLWAFWSSSGLFWSRVVLVCAHTLAVAHVYLAFRFADRSFADERRSPEERAKDEHKCVLVVDDDRVLRETLATVLEEEGYCTISAGSGMEALSRMKEGLRPGVIFLDLSMPEMSGWAFRAEQLQHDSLAAVPVVIMSGHSPAADTAPFLGAADYLQKPLDLDRVLKIIESLRIPRCRKPPVVPDKKKLS